MCKIKTGFRLFEKGKIENGSVGKGECEQTRKKVSYKTVLNTCLSFLNDCKKRSGTE